MDEKQFKKLAHELVVDITSTIGTFSLELDVTDEALAKTQKLIEECAVMLAEFIDSRKPKFKVGDYVVDESCDYIARIDHISDMSVHGGRIYELNDSRFGGLPFGCPIELIRHATPEEIAEYESALNFRKHGRKPFEVKKGDLLFNNERVRRFFVADPSYWQKNRFISGDFSLLKTAEEVEEWLGADNE